METYEDRDRFRRDSKAVFLTESPTMHIVYKKVGSCFMNQCCFEKRTEFGPNPFVTNVTRKAMQNTNFRTALWTGCYGQMTLMCIPVGEDIGPEVHEDTDQIIRIEEGFALVKMGECECTLEIQVRVCKGETIFVPAGTWHNIINMGRMPLKVSSIYAPSHHPAGTVQRTKKEAEDAQY